MRTPAIPKILVIDDQFGSSLKDRRNLCALFGLNDITGDDTSPEPIKDPVAEAVFCSGQIRAIGHVENNVKIAHDAAAKGWPSSDGWRWALILLDLRFVSGALNENGEPTEQDGDDTFGLSILDDIHNGFPDIPIIVISSRDRNAVIVDCRTKGAADFIQRVGYGTDTKPPREILVEKITEHGLIEDNRTLKNEKSRIVGRSIAMMKALRDARRAATGAGNILLLGETGVGKELLARYVHDLSSKKMGHYEVFNPHDIAETLQEDRLFGHIQGAYSGASSAEPGIFELANNGTLFIDEFGDIKQNLQNQLLRPLEARCVKRQGGSREIPLNIQVVLATNKNLDEDTQAGRFKKDLLNRVKSYPITLPPLRERKEDIPVIASQLLENLCRENSARWPRKILTDTLKVLMDYEWPDNIRGLRNVLERAVKNNKDAEIVVPSDINFGSSKEPVDVASPKAALEIVKEEYSLDRLIGIMSEFQFQKDYSKLHGKLPDIQKAIAKFLANYLLSAVDVSKKRRAGATDGELNIAGAASCMMGIQLKTPKAADLIKKLLQTDKNVLNEILDKNPSLKEMYHEVLRLRPSKPNKKQSSRLL